MDHYDNPHDKRIYDIEQVKEWARQDVISEIAETKLKKKRKQAIISVVIISGLLLTLLYTLWLFTKSVQF